MTFKRSLASIEILVSTGSWTSLIVNQILHVHTFQEKMLDISTQMAYCRIYCPQSIIIIIDLVF